MPPSVTPRGAGDRERDGRVSRLDCALRWALKTRPISLARPGEGSRANLFVKAATGRDPGLTWFTAPVSHFCYLAPLTWAHLNGHGEGVCRSTGEGVSGRYNIGVADPLSERVGICVCMSEYSLYRARGFKKLKVISSIGSFLCQPSHWQRGQGTKG